MLQRRCVLVYQHQYEESNPTEYLLIKELYWIRAVDEGIPQPAQTNAR